MLTDSSGAATAPIPAQSFDPTVSGASGYLDATLLRGRYTVTPSATPGLHKIRVTATDGRVGNLLDFYQPQISSASPAAIGQGANEAPITITGTGFNPISGATNMSLPLPDLVVLGLVVTTPHHGHSLNVCYGRCRVSNRIVKVLGADSRLAVSSTTFR